MPDRPTDTLPTELDALATPYEACAEVDLLLQDLAPNATAAERSAHRAAVVAADRGGAGRAVLVVDSTPIARKFLMQRLQRLGYDAHGAANADDALGRVEQQAFAIVFLELALAPENGIDGLSLCRAIKQPPGHPRGIPPAVVITTGLVDSASRVRGSLAGCDAFLSKPLIEAEFVAALRQVDPLFQ